VLADTQLYQGGRGRENGDCTARVPPEGSQVHVRRPKEVAYAALGAKPLRCKGFGGKLSSEGLSPLFPRPPKVGKSDR